MASDVDLTMRIRKISLVRLVALWCLVAVAPSCAVQLSFSDQTMSPEFPRDTLAGRRIILAPHVGQECAGLDDVFYADLHEHLSRSFVVDAGTTVLQGPSASRATDLDRESAVHRQRNR